MEPDTLITLNGHGACHQNGVPEQPPELGNEDSMSKKVNDSFESETESKEIIVFDESAPANTSNEKVTEETEIEREVTLISKEQVSKNSNQPKHAKLLKVKGTSKIEKPISPKSDIVTGLKRNKDGKDTKVGTTIPNSHQKQTSKSGSLNDRHMTKDAISNKQQFGKIVGTPSVSVAKSESLPEITKPKTLKKVLPSKDNGAAQSSNSSAEGDSKKVGAIPKYSFNFRCDERAEKRREFYTKIEEKIHAKEAEKTTLQAKSKESQEAEIKMLRKSLTFKASPMPSFYQEPPLPKQELKKIPPTRAKSPKLGRRKSPTTAESDENGSHTISSGRMSLGDKVSENKLSKGSSDVHSKKPLRKSLPKLPSKKSTLSNSKKEVPSAKEVKASHAKMEAKQPEAEAVEEHEKKPILLNQQVQSIQEYS